MNNMNDSVCQKITALGDRLHALFLETINDLAKTSRWSLAWGPDSEYCLVGEISEVSCKRLEALESICQSSNRQYKFRYMDLRFSFQTGHRLIYGYYDSLYAIKRFKKKYGINIDVAYSLISEANDLKEIARKEEETE